MQYPFKLLITLCIAMLLFSCATIDSREPAAERPAVIVDAGEATTEQPVATTPDTAEAKTEKTKLKRNKAVVVVGAVVATALTIWAVTEYIEEKVVPVVLTLVAAGLIYEASRNKDSATEN